MALLDSFCDLMSQRFYFVMEFLGILNTSRNIDNRQTLARSTRAKYINRNRFVKTQ